MGERNLESNGLEPGQKRREPASAAAFGDFLLPETSISLAAPVPPNSLHAPASARTCLDRPADRRRGRPTVTARPPAHCATRGRWSTSMRWGDASLRPPALDWTKQPQHSEVPCQVPLYL
jgi:hypothetical protein